MTKAKDVHEALERRRLILMRRLFKHKDSPEMLVKIAKELKRISTYGEEEQ